MIRKMLPAVVAIGGLLGTAAGADAAATTGREYVVVYEQGASDAAARAAIEAAGGRVVSENTDIGVATVRTSDTGFAAEVAGSAAIVGATTNRVIGKAPQDAVKRDAVEHDVGSIRGGAPFGGALRRRPARRAAVGHADDPCHPAGLLPSPAGLEGGARRHHRHRHRRRAIRTSRRTSTRGSAATSPSTIPRSTARARPIPTRPARTPPTSTRTATGRTSRPRSARR